MPHLLSPHRTLARFLCALLLVSLWCGQAHAQGFQDLLGLKKSTADGLPVTWQVQLVPGTAANEVQLQVTAEIPPDNYIYSTAGKSGAQTQITLTRTEGLTPLTPSFQADRLPKFVEEPSLDGLSTVEKYFDHVTWTRNFKLNEGVDPATVSLSGQIKYQVCDKNNCRLPEPHPFTVAFAPNATPAATNTAAATPAPKTAAPADLSYEHLVGRKDQKKRAAAWKVHVQPRQARPGDTVTVSVQVELESGWHVYALDQTLNADGFGPLKTIINVGGSPRLQPLEAGFVGPKPHEEPSEGFENLIERSHAGRTVWTRAFRIAKDAPAGPLPVEVTVEYQMCNAVGCQPPAEFTVQGSVVVAEAPVAEALLLLSDGAAIDPSFAVVAPDAGAADHPAAPAAGTEQVVASASTKGLDKSQGLMMFLIAAVVAGFAALLTPCVFPMIPITVSFFLKQSEREHHKPVTMAGIYCLGIIGTFTGLGLLMSVLFDATKLNELANNGWLNLLIAGVLVFFAFNLLGLFEIRIPSWLLTYTSGQESRGGFVGVLFMALTFTLTSFTCTFAFAGGLLAAAANGDRLWPILGLLAFSAAFSLPFFFLALFPSFLQKLPKSGGWMNLVKVVMGLVELGAAFKFLSVADLTWNPTPMFFDYELVVSAWMVISITAGAYLLGLFRLPHDTPTDHIGVVRLVSAMTFFGLSAYLAVGLFATTKPTGKIWENIQAFAPPRFEDVSNFLESPVRADEPANANGVPGPYLVHNGLKYALDVEEALKFAVRENRPVFLDFTGVNCVNCRLMEKGPMSKPHVKDKLSQFVRVQLFTDRVPKIQDDAEAERLVELNRNLQRSWYGNVTLPAYVVIPPDPEILQNPGKILASFEGMEQVEGSFAEFLDEGLNRWKTAAQKKSVAQKSAPPELLGQR